MTINNTVEVPGARKRAKRGKRFWICAGLAALVAAPFIIYFIILGYVAFGFMTPQVESGLNKVFDAPVKIGALNTRWLKNLRMEDLTVQAADKSTPLTVGSVNVDWDLGPMLADNHIKSATVDRLQLKLLRDNSGRWNLRLAPQENTGNGYRIDEFTLRDSDISVAWAPGRKVHLQGIGGSFEDRGVKAASPFSLKGILDSQETFSISGTAGPGESYDAHLNGGFYPERDFSSVLGPDTVLKGRMRYDLSVKSNFPVAAFPSGQVAVKGNVGLENFQWELVATKGSEMALDIPKRSLDLEGTVILDNNPDSLCTVKDMQLNSEGLGFLNGDFKILLKPGPNLSVMNAHGELGMHDLNEIFRPRLLGDVMGIRGNLEVSNMRLTSPIGMDSPALSIVADLKATDADLDIPGMGHLPPTSAAATMDWPALKKGTLSVGDVARTEFEINDLDPVSNEFWLSFTNGATLRGLHIDIGRFFQSEFGRRIVSGTAEAEKIVPEASKLPLLMKGTLSADTIKLISKPGASKRTILSLPDLKLNGIAVEKWPLPFKLPRRILSGSIASGATLGGTALQEISLAAKIFAILPATIPAPGKPPTPGDAAPPMELDVSTTLSPEASGVWKPGLVNLRKLSLPLADLTEMAGDLAAGNSAAGNLILSDGVFDPLSGNFSGTASMQNAYFEFKFTAGMQKAMASLLKITKYASLAAILEQYPLEKFGLDVKDARFNLTYKERRFVLRGRSLAMDVRINVPILGDYKAVTIPAVEIALSIDESVPGRAMYSASLIESGLKLALNMKSPEANSNVWVGNVEFSGALGMTLAADASFDPVKNQVGRSVLNIQALDTAAVNRLLSAAGMPETLASALPANLVGAKIEIDPVDLNQAANGKSVFGATVHLGGANKLRATMAPDVAAPAGSDSWIMKGNLESSLFGGVLADFEAPLDFKLNKCGKSYVHLKSADLGAIGGTLKSLRMPDYALAGKLADLRVDLEPAYFSALTGQMAGKAHFSAVANDAGFTIPQADFAQLSGALACFVDTSSGDSATLDATAKLDSYEVLLKAGNIYIPKGRAGEIHLAGKCLNRYDGSDLVTVNVCEVKLEEQIKASLSGTYITAPDGKLAELNFQKLNLNIPDMAAFTKQYIQPNLSNLDPWFGDLGLQGESKFAGNLAWKNGGAASLNGKLGLKYVTILVGKQGAIAINQLNGELPVMLQSSEAAAAAPAGHLEPEERAELSIESLQFSALRGTKQSFKCVATPNALRFESPVVLQTPAGPLTFDDLRLNNLLGSAKQPEIRFKLLPKIDLNAIMLANGVLVNGMQNCVLSGQGGKPLECLIAKTAGKFGWELQTTGGLSAPFFGGQILVETLHARGLFGPAPVVDGDIRLKGETGIKITEITEKNSQYGKFHIRVNAELTGLEFAPETLEIYKGKLQVKSVDDREKDPQYYYDGKLAMTLNYNLVRAAFPKFLFPNDADIEKLQFGVKRLSLGYELGYEGKEKMLIGPNPGLPGGNVIEGWGTEINPFARVFKKDIQGAPEHTPWSVMMQQYFQRRTHPDSQ